ncbi:MULTISPECIES: FecR family protein [Pseudomonas]|uniref:FecR domain-containing protein n=1 Tax=Pseudomonas auratipiscis TaxID=3115853 RepID=A0AB35WV59_9PSED|nr:MULTISPECIES: FecR domain-containing protein [unclassified Pseudomonas]MEE1867553.1 FecR domain-containing protein [Pseudomonas sp. 120P]MEE1958380.1 FecR domain-containing protein [Pseudomonas sp. 119P]
MKASPQSIDPIEHEAADWVVRHRQGQLSSRELKAYRRWLAADPLHAAAAQRVDRAWQASAQLKQYRGYVKPQRPPRRSWLQMPLVTGSTVTALALGCWMLLAPPFWLQAISSDYHTGFGEVRQITLADGSQVELGSHSILNIAYGDQRRVVHLSQGEAVFTPAPMNEQEQRPFTVSTPGADITARGTRYLVGVGDNREGWVGVLQHRVEVNLVQREINDVAGSTWLDEGNSLTFSPLQGLTPLSISPQELASWQEGRLVFQRESLANAVSRINRYRTGLVMVKGEALRDVQISAVMRLDNLDDALQRLATQAHARIIEFPGLTLIY